MCAEILIYDTHGLTSFVEDCARKQCLPPKRCWCPWPGIKPATLVNLVPESQLYTMTHHPH